jgi:hypothetical protein
MSDMSEHDEREPGVDDDEFSPEEGATAGDGRAQSVMERLKAKREAIGAQTHITMEIPGYDGELVGKFKRMRWEALADVAEQAERSRVKRKQLNGHADVIATACEELLIRKVLPGGDVEDIPMHEMFPEDFNGTPVRFDPRLATWLELKLDGTPTARKVVFGVFNNDLAVTAMHNDLGAWMQSSKSEEDEDFSKS